MEKRKKISGGTVICLCIILILVVVLGVTYYFGFVKEDSSSEKTQGTSIEQENMEGKEEENSKAIPSSKNITKEDLVGVYTAKTAKDSNSNDVDITNIIGMHAINLFFYENGKASIDTKTYIDEDDMPQPMDATYEVKNNIITLTFKDSSVEKLKYNNDGFIEFKYENYTLYFERNNDFQYEGDKYAEEIMNDEAYEKFISEYSKSNKNFKSIRIDIDNDGIEELLLTNGKSGGEKTVTYYTYKDGEVKNLGTLSFGNRILYKMKNNNYLLEVYGHMGLEEVSKVYIKNGKIQKDLISTREINEGEDYQDYQEAEIHFEDFE